MSEIPCPLCRNTKRMRRPKLLYGNPVCKKCYYKFANRRQLAYILDSLILFAISFPAILALDSAFPNQPANDIVSDLYGWIIFPLILSFKDGFAGRSLGKFITNVKVIHPDTTEPISFKASFKRNLPLIIPIMPLIIAFTLQKGHRLGDGWANTKVIWSKYADHPVFTGRYTCAICQYNLTGNTSGQCPECGAGITPPTTPTTPTDAANTTTT